MLKITKKISLAILAILLIVSTTCLAATASSEKAKLEIVENNICTIKINDFSTFEKKIVDYDLEKKNITIGLTIKNTAEPIVNPPYEIVLVIDNSLSMIQNEVSEGVTRLKQVTDSAKTLASKLLENENTKVAVVSFSTGDDEGTLSDAKLRNKLSSDKEVVLSSITEIATDETQGPRTNIDAGLQIAKTCFSEENNNKYIVLLTDGVPNTAVGGPTFTYSEGTATKTVATLKSLDKANINIISAMIGLNPSVIEPTTQCSYKNLSEEIFGTQEEPTVGKFYNVADKNIETAITKTIFSNIIDTTVNTLTNIDIYDYFPQQIVDNFDFEMLEYIAGGDKINDNGEGENYVTERINSDNCIIWHIAKLEPGQTAYVSYKLTLKDKIDTNILNIVLNTNEKVDITANEIKTDDDSNILKSTVSPKIKVTMPEEKPKDNTVADKEIPQTGTTSSSTIMTVILLVITFVIGIRFYLLNRNSK